MNLSVGVHKDLLFWTLYQGMALAVPWNRRKVWASAPVDPGKPQWLKPLTTDVAARLKPCPDTRPATEFHIYVAHPSRSVCPLSSTHGHIMQERRTFDRRAGRSC